MKNLNTILSVINIHSFDEEVVKKSISIAKDMDAQLHFVYAIDISLIDIKISQDAFKETINENEIKKELQEKIDALYENKISQYLIHICIGDFEDQIIHLAQKIRAGLLILSSLASSMPNNLTQKSSLALLYIKNKAKEKYKNILAPVDLSDLSKQSVFFSKMLCKSSDINLVFAYNDVDDLTMQYTQLYSENEQSTVLGVSHVTLFKKNVSIDKMKMLKSPLPAKESLLVYIKNTQIDLLVLGYSGFGIVSSTTEYLLKNTNIDTLIYVPKK